MPNKTGAQVRTYPWLEGRGLSIDDLVSPPEIKGDEMLFHVLDNEMKLATLYLVIQEDQTIFPMIGYRTQEDGENIVVKICGIFQVQVQKEEWVTIDLRDLPKNSQELVERLNGGNFSIKTIKERKHE